MAAIGDTDREIEASAELARAGISACRAAELLGTSTDIQVRRRRAAIARGLDAKPRSEVIVLEPQWWHAVQVAVLIVPPFLFAALHLAYSQFYDAFGLDPEDVGLDFPRILVTSVTWILLGFVSFIVAWFAVLMPIVVTLATKPDRDYSPIDRPTGTTRRERLRSRVKYAFLKINRVFEVAVNRLEPFTYTVAGSGFFVIFFAILLWRTPISGGFKYVALVLLVPVPIVLIAADLLPWRFAGFRDKTSGRWQGFIFSASLLAFILGAATTYNDLHGIVARYRDRAASGKAFSSVTVRAPLFSIHAFDIRAEVADLDWRGKRPKGVRGKDCLLFLGSSGGTSYIYDVRQAQILGVSTVSAVIVARPHSKKCPP